MASPTPKRRAFASPRSNPGRCASDASSPVPNSSVAFGDEPVLRCLVRRAGILDALGLAHELQTRAGSEVRLLLGSRVGDGLLGRREALLRELDLVGRTHHNLALAQRPDQGERALELQRP